MRSFLLGLGLLLLAAEGGAAPAAKPANLLANGSFEDGPEVKDFLSVDKDSTAIKGWRVTRGQIDIVASTYWPAFDGKRSIDLHGSPGFGGIAQTFKTKKGKKYRVTFQLAGTPGAGERSVVVEAAGEKKTFDTDPGDSTREKLKWDKITWDFTAIGDETTLEIATPEKGDSNQGPIIDDVVVAEK